MLHPLLQQSHVMILNPVTCEEATGPRAEARKCKQPLCIGMCTLPVHMSTVFKEKKTAHLDFIMSPEDRNRSILSHAGGWLKVICCCVDKAAEESALDNRMSTTL